MPLVWEWLSYFCFASGNRFRAFGVLGNRIVKSGIGLDQKLRKSNTHGSKFGILVTMEQTERGLMTKITDYLESHKFQFVYPAFQNVSNPRTSKFPDVVELNVGGKYFATSVETLTRCKGSVLEEFFLGDPDSIPRDKDGRFSDN